MTCVCIIPARGQSKRLPRKNILPLAGRPMLAWPIEAARKSKLFDRIMVSTEDREIAEAAKAAGAETIDRPSEIAADRSTVVEVCLHALDKLEKDGETPDTFCCVYATAAFISADDLVASRALMNNPENSDFVMGVCEYDLPPLLALREADNGTLTPMFPEYHHMHSQDFPKLVCSSGAFYWARTEAFRARRSFYGPPLCAYRLPRSRALDIDTPEQYRDAMKRASLAAPGANP